MRPGRGAKANYGDHQAPGNTRKLMSESDTSKIPPRELFRRIVNALSARRELTREFESLAQGPAPDRDPPHQDAIRRGLKEKLSQFFGEEDATTIVNFVFDEEISRPLLHRVAT